MNVPPLSAAAPKARIKTSGAATHVADIKARARKMLATGTISRKQHDGLLAKADKVQAALDGAMAPE